MKSPGGDLSKSLLRVADYWEGGLLGNFEFEILTTTVTHIATDVKYEKID